MIHDRQRKRVLMLSIAKVRIGARKQPSGESQILFKSINSLKAVELN